MLGRLCECAQQYAAFKSHNQLHVMCALSPQEKSKNISSTFMLQLN